MIDYRTDPGWNLDMARKNATRCAGYLKRVDSELVEAAQILERQIMELIEEETDDRDGAAVQSVEAPS